MHGRFRLRAHSSNGSFTVDHKVLETIMNVQMNFGPLPVVDGFL